MEVGLALWLVSAGSLGPAFSLRLFPGLPSVVPPVVLPVSFKLSRSCGSLFAVTIINNFYFFILEYNTEEEIRMSCKNKNNNEKEEIKKLRKILNKIHYF